MMRLVKGESWEYILRVEGALLLPLNLDSGHLARRYCCHQSKLLDQGLARIWV